MADSSITKQALAHALKGLMAEMPFEKITVTNICERCNLNRKSFYYHFQDKYDLVNWIFDTEVTALMQQESRKEFRQPDDASTAQNSYARFLKLNDYHTGLLPFCEYLYENRSFYRAALQIKGQNSFVDHFREFLHPIFIHRITSLLNQYGFPLIEEQHLVFYVEIMSDTFINAIQRWMQTQSQIQPDEFVTMLFSLIHTLSCALTQESARSSAPETGCSGSPDSSRPVPHK